MNIFEKWAIFPYLEVLFITLFYLTSPHPRQTPTQFQIQSTNAKTRCRPELKFSQERNGQ